MGSSWIRGRIMAVRGRRIAVGGVGAERARLMDEHHLIQNTLGSDAFVACRWLLPASRGRTVFRA